MWVESALNEPTTRAEVLGVTIEDGTVTTLRVERVKGGAVELCGSTTRCAILPYWDDLMY